MVLFALLSSGFVGFAIGLFSFRVKSGWCPDHGTTLTCSECLTGPDRRSAAKPS